tara:strand:- start:35 stop:178 length:144 start_codon:yes stop_codon:yes gene_type:complete
VCKRIKKSRLIINTIDKIILKKLILEARTPLDKIALKAGISSSRAVH